MQLLTTKNNTALNESKIPNDFWVKTISLVILRTDFVFEIFIAVT